MIKVVEQQIELVSIAEARCLGDDAVIGTVEGLRKPSKHPGNGQVKFVVAIK